MDKTFEKLLEEITAKRSKTLVGLMKNAHRRIGCDLRAKLHARGYVDISIRHSFIFSNLDTEGTNIVTLAERAGMTKQAMSKLVKEVLEQGYVTTEKDPNDSRALIVRISEKGARFILNVYEASEEVMQDLKEEIGDKDMDMFMQVLKKF